MVKPMRMFDIIAHKRDKKALTDEEIRFFIQGYLSEEIPDYQVSALLMAICLNGMNAHETRVLTETMRDSGDRVDLSLFGGKTVDKHSTGGVGDKTSLIVAPLAASLGCKVAKMSGRGLGHTGGTIDKLESIPGFCTELSPEAFQKQVKSIGVAIVGQSGNLTPADKKLYALRDVTATVNCIPLIASSIMSKKLAAGSDHIVLDVKVGSGAFMKTIEEAELLAHTMVEIGRNCGKSVKAVLTNMDTPLGCAVGNALEVAEAMDILQGRGDEALRDVCLALAAAMVSSCLHITEDEAARRVNEALCSGQAYHVFLEWIRAQGGEINALPLATSAQNSQIIQAPQEGYLSHMDTELIGTAALLLGAGRRSKEDSIDPLAGLWLNKKTGDYVKQGEPLATLYSNTVADMSEATSVFLSALTFCNKKPLASPPIYHIIQ